MSIARALDSQGRPLKQIELCDVHLKALASERPVVTFCANPRFRERISPSQIAAGEAYARAFAKGCDLTRISVICELRAGHVLRMKRNIERDYR